MEQTEQTDRSETARNGNWYLTDGTEFHRSDSHTRRLQLMQKTNLTTQLFSTFYHIAGSV